MTRGLAGAPFDFRMLSPAMRWLVAVNVACFFLAWLVGPQFNDLFGMAPSHIWRDHWIWQPVTYLFLHGNFFHLLFNMFTLWMFAVPVESQWGSREFIKYYFLCGVGAGLVTAAVQPHSPAPIIGASGAVYGLLTAFAMLYTDAVIYLYFLFPIRARHMAILWGAIEFAAGLQEGHSRVARFTHLSGMAIGYFYLRWWWVVKIRAKAFRRDLREWSAGTGDAGPAARPPGAGRGAGPSGAARDEGMVEIDRILDKISAFGRDSLSEGELEALRRVSQKKPEGHA